MKTNSIVTLAGASVLALFFASCNKPETVREVEIEQKADHLEHEADKVRVQGEQAAEMHEERAAVIEETTEQRAGAIEERADDVRAAE